VASEAVSAPVSTTVIALDVSTTGAINASALTGFEKIIGDIARQLGSVSTEDGGGNLALTLAPGAAVAPVLMRLSTAVNDFETSHPGLGVRAVVHYGVVFRTETSTGVSYVGSAVRAARSTLRRMTATAGMTATREFAEFAAESHIQSKNFELQTSAVGDDGLTPIQFTEQRRNRDSLAGSDHALLEFLKKRLAEEVGPFAAPLVDNVSHSAMTAKEVVAALSHEINDPAARQRFETDALAFIKTRSPVAKAARSAAATPAKTPTKPAADPAPKESESRGLFSRILKR